MGKLIAVTESTFAKCMGDVKHVTVGDSLCPDCRIISEGEYIAGILNRYKREVEEALFRLNSDLSVVI